ncbi:MAG TPA: flagellar assembly peptidoglycan hydrolase FlgJ [Alcaligenaceae bacterium]|nr:flagellar assembly peptidoglycan hydrolase FlgJ [Alcaligenaceae bacterium]
MSAYYFPRPGTSQPVSIFDSSQLAVLRKGVTAAQADEESQQQVAQQFEALLIQQLIKQARQTASGNGLFDSQAVRMAQSIGDEQLALNLSNPGLGLAEALIAQMKQAQGINQELPSQRTSIDANTTRLPHLRSDVGEKGRLIDAPSLTDLIKKLSGSASPAERIASAVKGAPKHITEFVNKMRDAVQVAAAETGIPAKLIMSQAALESGWGKREILLEDGTTSHNLFGIKASRSWKGGVANITTSEFVNGKMVKMKQPFRAYESYAESLTDYARLISTSSRYESVLQASSAEEAARRVQEAGYATDPNYADKLISIMAYFDAGK